MVKGTLPVHEHCHGDYCAPFKRISWTAIFVGALIAIGLSFLLYIFGIAIGLSAVSVNDTGGSVIAIGGMIGIIIGLVASMMAAGYAAGYLGRFYSPQRNLGIVYGFTTWSVALILSSLVLTHIGNYASWYGHAMVGSDSVVQVSTSSNAPALDVKQAVVADTDTKAANDTKKVTQVTVAPETLAWSAGIMFFLFFLGALSCCIGACWGMICHRED